MKVWTIEPTHYGTIKAGTCLEDARLEKINGELHYVGRGLFSDGQYKVGIPAKSCTLTEPANESLDH